MLAVRSGGPDKNNSPLTDIPICGEMNWSDQSLDRGKDNDVI
jgi:hypothetical protein